MKHFLTSALCLIFSATIGVTIFNTLLLAQSSDEPASRDEVIIYFRTMHSYDLLRRTMEVQSKTMEKLFHDQVANSKDGAPADFDAHLKKAMDELIKNMPVDEITQAMIPAYQKHFTKSDIEAMNAFYSSPVGQKVLQELPGVMQEGMEAAMPIMSKYLGEWKDRVQKETDQMKSSPAKATPSQN